MKRWISGFLGAAGAAFFAAGFCAYAEEGSSEAQEGALEIEQVEQEQQEQSQAQEPQASPLMLNYFGILYGPSLGNPTSYQPDLLGRPDPNKPLILKNFITAAHNFSDFVTVAATGYWIWQPVQKQDLQMQDPSVRISHNSLFYYKGLNLYGDFRVHLPISTASHANQQLLGLQSFQALTYDIANSRAMLGLFTSQRRNFFGPNGEGNAWEFYIAPNANVRLSRTVALSVLYEIYLSRTLGAPAGQFNNDGTDLEPGIIWDITPNVMVNPYLNLLPAGKISLKSTSVGLMVSLNFM